MNILSEKYNDAMQALLNGQYWQAAELGATLQATTAPDSPYYWHGIEIQTWASQLLGEWSQLEEALEKLEHTPENNSNYYWLLGVKYYNQAIMEANIQTYNKRIKQDFKTAYLHFQKQPPHPHDHPSILTLKIMNSILPVIITQDTSKVDILHKELYDIVNPQLQPDETLVKIMTLLQLYRAWNMGLNVQEDVKALLRLNTPPYAAGPLLWIPSPDILDENQQ